MVKEMKRDDEHSWKAPKMMTSQQCEVKSYKLGSGKLRMISPDNSHPISSVRAVARSRSLVPVDPSEPRERDDML